MSHHVFLQRFGRIMQPLEVVAGLGMSCTTAIGGLCMLMVLPGIEHLMREDWLKTLSAHQSRTKACLQPSVQSKAAFDETRQHSEAPFLASSRLSGYLIVTGVIGPQKGLRGRDGAMQPYVF